MPVYVSKPDQSEYIPAPMGLHQAVCVDVEDLGTIDTNFGPKRVVKIYWQTEDRNHEGKRYVVAKRYNATLHENSALRGDLKNWRGMDFNADELKKFDLESILGANCQINIVHNTKEKDGETLTFANVSSIVPPVKGSARLEGEEYTRRKDRDQQDSNFPPVDAAGGEPDHTEEEQPEFEMQF